MLLIFPNPYTPPINPVLSFIRMINSDNYQENLNLKIKPLFNSKLSLPLENIVFNEKSGKENSSLESLFFDKSKTLKANVKALLDDICRRESLNLHLLDNIDDDISKQNTKLMNIESLRTHYDFEEQKEISNKKLKLDGNILELNKEKRKEYLECWRDLMFMRKYLMSSLREYWDLVKRRGMLGES